MKFKGKCFCAAAPLVDSTDCNVVNLINTYFSNVCLGEGQTTLAELAGDVSILLPSSGVTTAAVGDETPHVNVLSKVDLMDKYGDLDFNLEYYADVQDLHYLADRILGENDEPEGGASSTRRRGARSGPSASPTSTAPRSTRWKRRRASRRRSTRSSTTPGAPRSGTRPSRRSRRCPCTCWASSWAARVASSATTR